MVNDGKCFEMQTMTEKTLNHNSAELLSAMVDGELNAPVALESFQPGTLHAQWNVYQTIGDVLRAPGAATSATSAQTFGADPAFVQRLSLKLRDEKIGQPALLPAGPVVAPVAKPNAAAANDTIFRWKMLAGMASFGMAAVVAFNFVGLPGSKPEAQLAQATPGIPDTQRVVASPNGLMVRDARLEELLSAHKQLGGTSLQAPSGFLRHAGFESTPGSQR